MLKPHQIYITAPEIAEAINKNRITVWRWVESGKIPKPSIIASRCHIWERSSLCEYLAKHGKLIFKDGEYFTKSGELVCNPDALKACNDEQYVSEGK